MPLLDVFFTMMWFFLWVLWFFLLFRVIMDIFRSRDLGGWGKAGWLVFVIVLPFLGVLVYLIARGGKMADRDAAQAQDEAFRAYVRDAAHENGGTAGELAKPADLHDHGAISDADYQRGKDKALSRSAA
jgi:Phospholipase_D-nuclease N-terminal